MCVRKQMSWLHLGQEISLQHKEEKESLRGGREGGREGKEGGREGGGEGGRGGREGGRREGGRGGGRKNNNLCIYNACCK